MELLSESQGTYAGPKPGSPEHIRAITAELRRLYTDAKCSLDFTNPLELLVATQLSAQCTDERVNLVTPDLFQKYRSAEDYATVSHEELERDIRSTGFYRKEEAWSTLKTEDGTGFQAKGLGLIHISLCIINASLHKMNRTPHASGY